MFPFFQWTLVIRNHAVHPSGTMVIQLEYHCLTICCSNFRTTLAKLSAEARGHQPAYGQHVAMLLMDTHFHLKGISDVYWYPKLLYGCLRAACFRHIIFYDFTCPTLCWYINDSSSAKCISLYTLELVLVLTQLSGASANCFCLASKHHVSWSWTICLLFILWQQQYAPYHIGSNNRANTFISKCFH